MTPAELRRWVGESRAKQGLPARITPEETARLVAVLTAAPVTPRPKRGTA